MSIRIYLDRPGPDGRAHLRLALLRAGRQCWLNLPVRVRPQDWNKRKQRLRASAPGATRLNAQLEKLAARAEALLLSGEPLEKVRDRLRVELGLNPQERRLLALYDEWLRIKSLTVKASSLQVLRRARRLLEAFAGSLTPDRIDSAFLERFQAMLTRERGMQPSTANKMAACVRSFLLWLEERGLIEKAPRPLSLPEARRDVVFLTVEELRRFAEVDLSGLPEGYEKARTVFLMACYTGLRISDLKSAMHPEAWDMIDLEQGVWYLREQKTDVFKRWPLATPARRLLEARRQQGARSPLPRISEQNTNRYIKEIARRAGITAPVRVGDREFSKWQLLTLHAGRRTFITLVAHASGTAVLLGLTHQDLDTLQKYLGALDETRRRAIEKAFQGLWRH